MNEERHWLDAVMSDGNAEPKETSKEKIFIPPAPENGLDKPPVHRGLDLLQQEPEAPQPQEPSDPLKELFSEEISPSFREETPKTPPIKKKNPSPVSPIVEFAEVVVGALVAAILVLTLICRTGVVDGTSMVPTMHHGDRYLISDLFYTPEQGDIVVFRPEVDGDNELWIKRIVAVEGQTVYIDPNDYKVYVDGKVLEEPYLEGAATIPKSTENPITVPEGSVYVLGDNRAISHDSRYEDLGCVPVSHLAGRVILRFWPLRDFGFCE